MAESVALTICETPDIVPVQSRVVENSADRRRLAHFSFALSCAKDETNPGVVVVCCGRSLVVLLFLERLVCVVLGAKAFVTHTNGHDADAPT